MTTPVLEQPLSPSGEGPAFDSPWQAQAFSLVVHLHRGGLFPWQDWVAIFSAVIKEAPATAEESVNDAYYRQWLLATERLVESLGLTTAAAIAERTEAWRQAYLNTPHGQAVALSHASCPPATGHHHHPPRRAPVAVCQAH
ncbi:nitrile hydratase accessory protein [Pseudomonas oryzihabitans]|uniref:nitrile hydratase accessory protein n=1 Tax=Pseudomonas oryzihabitans TaxID=47885 RepID=UPI0028651DD2|nr:nitrile hydratase accessory protein [Pseudomonas psychrotolerans]MDR6677699.1 nitrile hydratase accessory protein [Pseudomonas psychrotolerans]